MSERGKQTGKQQAGNKTARDGTPNNEKTPPSSTKNVNKPGENKKAQPGKDPKNKVTKETTSSKTPTSVPTGKVAGAKNVKAGLNTPAEKSKPTVGSGKKTPAGKDVKKDAATPQSGKTRATPTKGGPRGKGKRRKPRISPEEMRRRQLAEWLKVQGFLLGLRASLQAPSEPYCMRRQREFQRAYKTYNYNKEMNETLDKIVHSQQQANDRHISDVRARHKSLVFHHFKMVSEAERRLEQRLDELHNKKVTQQRELQKKLHAERMREIKLDEQRKREQRIRRQDEDRVVRILKSKYKVPYMLD